jgi:ornithine decarboxylase
MVMAPSAILSYHEESINFDKVDFIDNHRDDHESDATGFASKSLVQKVLKEHIAHIDVDTCEPGEEDAFYVADMGEIYRQHLRWKMNLGRVKPFYGMSATS